MLGLTLWRPFFVRDVGSWWLFASLFCFVLVCALTLFCELVFCLEFGSVFVLNWCWCVLGGFPSVRVICSDDFGVWRLSWFVVRLLVVMWFGWVR